jgi:macrolide-specific efflux system membrane fusion protein
MFTKINNWQKQQTKKTRLIILGSLIVVIAASFYFFTKNDGVQITYREVKAEIGNLEIKILATGTVAPQNRIEIKPPIAGRVEQVLIVEGQVVRRGQILAWMSSTERAALLDSARAKGEAELKKWEEIYPATPIMAPINGTIVLKNVEQGETFASADSLVSMSDRLIVKAQVDETDIAQIKVKQSAEIILDAYADQKTPAIVDKIAFDATTVSNVTTYIVDVLPKKVPEFMRSGMTANVTFMISSKENVLLVPSDALKMKNGKSIVMVRFDGDDLEREVEVGETNGKQVEIISGLKEGEVVLLPQLRLEKGKGGGSSPFNPMGKKR